MRIPTSPADLPFGGKGLALAAAFLLGATFLTTGGTPLREHAEEPLTASGIIQAETVSVASEFTARIAEIAVDEGDSVAAGAVIARLDTEALDAQIDAARATVQMAEAGLAQAKAGARPFQLIAAEAQLELAQTGVEVARQAVSDTTALVANPQEIELQLAVTSAQLDAARARQRGAAAQRDAADFGKHQAQAVVDQYGGGGRQRIEVDHGTVDDLIGGLPVPIPLPDPLPDGTYTYDDYELVIQDGTYTLYRWVEIELPSEVRLAPLYWWQAWAGLNASSAQVEGLEALLSNLQQQAAHPQSLESQADEAVAAWQEALAQEAMAQAQVDAMRNGATPEQIAILEAQVRQAHAALDALLEQRAMMTITAPIGGTVIESFYLPGEVVAQGAPLVTLARLDEVRLRVFVPENRLGRLHLGQQAEIRVDSFPDRTFTGTVSFISDRAEFTPRNVATEEERVNLVFAVEITIPNPEQRLKPGMPADVTFLPREVEP